jgi:iron complex outermembrane receptor protein
VFTYNHFINDFRFLARARYYDDWVVADYGNDITPAGPDGTGYSLICSIPGQPGNAPNESGFPDNCYDGEIIFDLEAAYTFADRYSLIVGMQNVADEQGPTDIDNSDGTIGSGNKYTDSNPWGFEGGFYYIRLRAEFE